MIIKLRNEDEQTIEIHEISNIIASNENNVIFANIKTKLKGCNEATIITEDSETFNKIVNSLYETGKIDLTKENCTCLIN